MMAEGTVWMAAPIFGKKLSRMAKHAAIRITRGSYTFVKASTPVFSPYVVLAGAPKKPARLVARPSPSKVRCRPGSDRYGRSQVALMAAMSPICSIMVASAMGAMVMQALTLNLAMLPVWMARPNQSACWMAVKSTSPMKSAAI